MLPETRVPFNGGYEALLDRFVAWAESRPESRAAVVLGSRARQERPADQWSDLDLWMVVTDAQAFLITDGWMEQLGRPLLSFVEPTATGDQLERRVLFEGGLDVDFIPVSQAVIDGLLRTGMPDGVRYILAAGYRIVVDKDNLAPLLAAEAAWRLPVPQLPAQADFTVFVNDFLYHVFWTAKKLGRGELWTAHACLDGNLKGMLLRLLKWHSLARHGTGYNTWHKGRFVEQWADAGAVAAFPDIFASYDPHAMRHALLATHRLFRGLAQETAALGGLVYPISDDDDDALGALLDSILEGHWSPD